MTCCKKLVRFSVLVILFFCSMILFGEEIAAPEFIKTVLPALNKPDEIEKLRSKRTPLPAGRQTALMNYFKKLDSKKANELALKIKLLPYLVSALSFDNFKKLLNLPKDGSILALLILNMPIMTALLLQIRFMIISQ